MDLGIRCLFILFILFGFICDAGAVDAVVRDCRIIFAKVYRVDLTEAKIQLESQLSKVQPHADYTYISYLGSGEEGGSVFLASKANGVKVALKHFYGDKVENLDNDIRAIGFLKKLSEKSQNKSLWQKFKIVNMKKLDEDTVELSYARGVDLKKLFNRVQGASDKEKVAETLESALYRVLKNIKEELLVQKSDSTFQLLNVGTTDRHLEFQIIENGNSVPIKFYLKPDNFLLGPGGELTLIDPY